MASVTEVIAPGYSEEIRSGHSTPAHTGLPMTKTIEQQTVTHSYAMPQQSFQPLDPDTLAGMQPLPRIFLRPIASPALLGMAMYFGGTWCFATYLCGWYNVPNIEYYLFPFIFLFGGLAQFIAGFYGFPARDNVVTVFHVSWGAFYLAYGLIIYFMAVGTLNNTSAYPLVTPFSLNNQPGIATWLVVMAAITWAVCLVSLGRDFLVFVVTCLQAVGATLMFAGWYAHSVSGAVKTGAYFMMVSALVALLYVFLFLVWDTVTDSALANNRSGQADNRFSGWRDHMVRVRGRLPWSAYGAPVRIPVSEPGIKKGQ